MQPVLWKQKKTSSLSLHFSKITFYLKDFRQYYSSLSSACSLNTYNDHMLLIQAELMSCQHFKQNVGLVILNEISLIWT